MVNVKIIITAVLCVLLMAGFAMSDDVVMIGNTGIPDIRLNRLDIRRMFLGEKREWSDQRKIVIATQKKGEIHDVFLKKYIGRSPFQYKNYWRLQLFTGKSELPPTFANDAEVIAFVGKTPGAIGYVSPTAVFDHVKIITIVGGGQ